MQLIIAEKPSVARDIARVLGIRPSGRQSFHGPERVVSWCVGHLVELEEPASYDPRWKAWRLDTLPMLPDAFKLRPVKGAGDQLRAVRDLLCDRRFGEVINACDAGREGELIFRYVYEMAGSSLPIRRLWISSMTDEAIQNGFAGLRPGAQYDALASAARCRSEADWIVGLNATRAVTVRHRSGPQSTLYSIGRVQTPTLAIVVEREKAIQQFVPHDYWEVRGTFSIGADGPDANRSFRALWTRERVTRFGTKIAVQQVLDRTKAHGAIGDDLGPVVEVLQQKKTHEAPPFLFDLTSLQRTANRRFGLSANQTLQAAQALYERDKLLTYPRTDSRYLSRDMIGELPRLFRGLERYPEYQSFVEPLVKTTPPATKRVFDDAKVSDHHAIIPTGKVVPLASLPRDEGRIFDLVARRFIGVFYPDAIFASTEVVIRVGPEDAGASARKAKPDADSPDSAKATGEQVRPERAERPEEQLLNQAPPPPDRFVARGRIRLEPGWQTVAGLEVEKAGKADSGASEDQIQLPILKKGQKLSAEFESLAKQTKPPPRHNEASLLSAMETAGRQIDDRELRAAMKDTGLGTPATRAAIIETLIRRGFVTREGKQLLATPMGIALIGALPVASLGSPELTGQWEARLARIARGEEARDAFMRDIAIYVREVVDATRKAPVNRDMRSMPESPPTQTSPKSPPTQTSPKAPPTQTSPKSPPKAPPKTSPKKPPRFKVDDLACPSCKQGHLICGNRGWGCSRWREGCKYVVWFEKDGKRLTKAQLKKVMGGS